VNLESKRLLISSEASAQRVALSVAEVAQQLGADVMLALSGDDATIDRPAELRRAGEVLALDARRDEGRGAVRARVTERWGGLDGAVHVIAPDAREKPGTEAETAERAFLNGAYSLSAVARTALPLMAERGRAGGSIVGVTVDSGTGAHERRAGARAALEAVNRYLACELGARGIRVNLVAAASAPTKSLDDAPGPVSQAVCFLLSDWSRAVTGEILRLGGRAEV
jgi:enoyl-[acyl-carrier protein] reductase I